MPTITNYNLSEITEGSGNGLINLINYTSSQTNYLPGILLFFAIYIIVFLALKVKGTTTIGSFVASNFVGFLLALIMFPLGILPGIYLVIMIILLPLSGFLVFILGH